MHVNSSDPLAWWNSLATGLPPRGHLLRDHWRERWLRLHSLPGAKRYADTPEEAREIVQRHEAVGSALFTAGEPLFVFRAIWEPSPRRSRSRPRPQIAGRQFRETVCEMGEDPPLQVRGLATTWKPDFFEALVALVADNQEVGLSLASPATGNMLCPYDGGMDVFSVSVAPNELAARFAAWRSSQPDGL
ncbi:DUF3885 domain-containing protein [Roseateles depolymerans]|uniref:DUF3885 domain-containing protein n=1 Tax=Roseateles depolymerans TaxID=76731 RepID=A0A0U3MBE4_9BURK|nr:hypothetical protein [Roseateles depolymerans]ALV04812.1 hypothetical protein RD2015_309 [Roseateles depolymerans]REG15177.1 hypothetical protein DES44_3683 [Roseateles depolymerans]